MKAWIVAVPERLDYVSNVLIPALSQGIITDTQVLLDSEKRGALWNTRRAWSGIATTDVGMLIQDDMILHPDFHAHLPDVIANIPSKYNAVNLFAPPRVSIIKAYEDGKAYLRDRTHFMWNCAIAMSGDFAQRLLAYDSHGDKNDYVRKTIEDDVVMMHYIRTSKDRAAYCVPSLVQHKNENSTMGNPKEANGWERISPVYVDYIPAGHYA